MQKALMVVVDEPEVNTSLLGPQSELPVLNLNESAFAANETNTRQSPEKSTAVFFMYFINAVSLYRFTRFDEGKGIFCFYFGHQSSHYVAAICIPNGSYRNSMKRSPVQETCKNGEITARDRVK